MTKSITIKLFYLFICGIFFICVPNNVKGQYVDLRLVGTYSTSIFDQGATEISTFDSQTNRLFSVNASTGSLDVIDLNDPTNPTFLFSIDLSPYGASANSVTIHDGIIATAVENTDKQANGNVVFFDANGNYINQLEVGALPDMITYSPNGKFLLVANEGEPSSDYINDPLGTVSVIRIDKPIDELSNSDVHSIDFTQFDSIAIDSSIKINGPGALVSQDLEPEYIAVASTSKKAYITLQENNAIATINLQTLQIESLKGLGYKNHSNIENALDASDKNSGVVNITTWPVYGLYQPDAITSVKIGNANYLITANEGDVRDYSGFAEAKRIKDLDLDDTIFPDEATLKLENNLGRLNVTTSLGDIEGDGDYDALYSFGARSFSIWNTNTELVYDSGDDLEQLTFAQYPLNFNASNTSNTLKGRSDDKGPEPEGLATAKILGKTFLFLGLERMGGVAVFNISNVLNPQFMEYENNRNFAVTPAAGVGGDNGPEGLLFIPLQQSPNGKNLLLVSNEISGSINIYETDYSCTRSKVTVCFDSISYCVDTITAQAYLLAGGTLGSCNFSERIGSSNFDVSDEAVSRVFTYPNPASDQVNILFENVAIGTYTIQLFDMMGNILIHESLTIENESSVNTKKLILSNLSTGTYFYQIMHASGNEFSGKIMVTK